MARPRTAFRNELKTRVTDRVYEGVQRYLTERGCASEARAIAELLEVALFGMVGSLAREADDFRHRPAQNGPQTRYSNAHEIHAHSIA